MSTALVVLLVALVEMMSSAGLYIAFGHGEPLLWKRSDTRAEPPMSPVGDVARFALAATREAPGTVTDLEALFEGYRVWCATERVDSLTRDDFAALWQALANEVGWRIDAGRACDLELAASADASARSHIQRDPFLRIR